MRLAPVLLALLVSLSVARLAGADETLVWELKPYRINVRLVPEWEGHWSDRQLAELCEWVMHRSHVEIGRPWELNCAIASRAVRRAVIGAGSPGELSDQQVEQILSTNHKCDKLVLVSLHTNAQGAVVVGWEFDRESRRWSIGRRSVVGLAAVRTAVFESVDAVIAPVGLVKLASGHRVVLRQQASLLPIRNQRRRKVSAGSVFEVRSRLARRVERPESAQEKIFLVVEELDEQGVVCRIASHSDNPLEDTSLDQWIAIESIAQHPGTALRLSRNVEGTERPLTGCEIWVTDRQGATGKVVGCPDGSGRLFVRASDGVRWARVKVGGVTLREYCLHVGAEPVVSIPTALSDAQLMQAGLLSECQDDVAELASLCGIYHARIEHRRDAGREEEADSLKAELDALLGKQKPALLDTIRHRRDEANEANESQAGEFAPHWAELIRRVGQL